MTTPEPPDARKAAEAALDMFIYAPVGLALEACELFPKLAERGRNQVVLARLAARYASQRAEAEAEKLRSRMTSSENAQPAAAPEPEKTAPTPAGKPSSKSKNTTSASQRPRVSAVGETALRTKLPIPGYDTLSASQVVPRLDALRPRELEAIKRHELARRGRRTILNRIAQLQD